MDNLHFSVALALPTFAVLASLVVSLFAVSGAREDARETRALVTGLASKVAALGAEVAAVREGLADLRSDVRILIRKVYEMMGGTSK